MILKALKILAVSIYAVGGGLLVLLAIPKVGWKALDVATGSMTPAIPQGSLVLIHHVAPSSLKVGDVVTYINPNNPKQTITHRIIEVTTKLGLPAFVTKGDANQTPDAEILGGNVVGKVGWHVPYLGRILSLVKQPLGLIVLVIIPAIFIIIDELRRLGQVLYGPKTALEPEPSLQVRPAKKTTTKPKSVEPPKSRPRRSLDGMRHLVVIGALMALVVHATLATLNSQAILTDNTIATATKANHLVISRVFLGGTGSVCPLLTNNVVTIIGTGPGSNVNVVIENTCHVEISNQTSVTVTNSSSQSSQSGSTSSNGNTSGGSSSSGNISNSSSQTTTVTIGGGSGLAVVATQWFELHNPTNVAVSLAGWKIRDDSGVTQILPTVTIPADGSVIIPANSLSGGQIGNGLVNTGDELVLISPTGATVDGLSWGNDTTILNPAITAIPVGGSVKRISPDYDTDRASDWLTQGP